MEEFRVHLAVFLSVNALAWVVWLLVTPGTFYWPLLVHLLWGIVLFLHFALANRSQRKRRVLRGYRPYTRAS
ncbi:MAG: hypothetical protein C4318_01355 [Acidimicrobiia bacterium]